MSAGKKSKQKSTRRLSEVAGRRSEKSGLPPGSLVHIGEPSEDNPKIRVITFGKKIHDDFELQSFDAIEPLLKSGQFLWINVDGLNRVDLIESLGKVFSINDLILEDILNTTQRPKAEILDNFLFIILKTLNFDEQTGETYPEQLSFILGHNYLLSFQELAGDPFDEIRTRMKAGIGKLQSSGPDFLLYALMDAVVDNYFVMLEKIAEKMEIIEDELVADPNKSTLAMIHKLKNNLIYVRRSVWPLREILTRISNSEYPFIQETTRPYLRDVYDHAVHVVDVLESYRDVASGMIDIYLSSVSNKLNETMKVLTIIATIFIPLTFITGWYGMNFKDMPELSWEYGYQMVMIIAGAVAAGMLAFFRRKGWF